MLHDEVKSFHDLMHEVQDRGICGRCGGCVSFCSAGEFHALHFGKDGSPEFADISFEGLGFPEGYTTAMVRSSMGERVYNGAKHDGFIQEMKFKKKEQSLLHRTTAMGKIVSFALRKQERAAETLGGVHA